ncbi:MAG: peptidyl-prolyl cis-trans isomerase [Deltaproteobacteria bacterium]|nr:peptidyl-prolyl cis-trans isomerase [Deltaproteobacteria bacterium]
MQSPVYRSASTIFAATACLALCAASPGCCAKRQNASAGQSDDNQPSKTIDQLMGTAQPLAMINGQPIYEEDLSTWLRTGFTTGKITPEIKKKALEMTIDAELAYQEAKRLGLDQRKDFQLAARQMAAQLRGRQRKELIRHFYNIEVAAKVTVGEKEAKAYYDEHQKAIGDEYHLVAVRFRNAAEAQDANRSLAEKKMTFDELAKQRVPSQRGDRERGVDLGYLSWRQMPIDWSQEIAQLKPGEHSTVLRHRVTGLQIVKLIARRTAKTPLVYEHIKGLLIEQLRDKRVHKAYEQRIDALRSKAKISFLKKS